MTISAEKIFNEIHKLSDENPDSLLNFEDEKELATQLLEKQRNHVTVMEAINKQIKQLAANKDAAIVPIKQLKADFNAIFETYKQEYSALKELLLTMQASYDTERFISKQYFINENEKIILNILNEV